MNVQLNNSDWLRLGASALAIFATVLIGWFLIGPLVTGIALVLAASLILFVQLQHFRQQEQALWDMRVESKQEREALFEQTEALIGLYFSLTGSVQPLPQTRGWAASPDFLRLVFNSTKREKPQLVVELGSGSSTIVGGYAIAQNGSGQIISFDHLEQFAAQTREMVSFHELGNHCHVLHAPLKTYQLNGGNSWEWYDLESFSPEATIDMIIVDGPPGKLQELSRYPALPLLADWISDEVTIIVDDGDREDEEAMVNKWLEDNPNLKYKYYNTEKGTYILKR